MAKFTLEEINQRKVNGESWREIGTAYDMKPESIRRAWNRMKDKTRREEALMLKRDKKEVTSSVKEPKKTPRESRVSTVKKYVLIESETITKIIRKVNQGEIDVREGIRHYFQTNTTEGHPYYGRRPKKAGGRLNPSINNVIEALVECRVLYMLKGGF